MNKSFLKVIH